MEIWKEVVNVKHESHKGMLEVSNLARVRSASRSIYIQRGKGFISNVAPKVISQCVANNGYLEVAIRVGGIRKKYAVHRLVALAFCDGWEEGLTVNHINGIKTDNRPENLEWVSISRNSQHQWQIGLADLRGENQPNHKLTSKRVVYIRKLLSAGVSPNTIAIVADISPAIIYRIQKGKAWKHIP